MPGREEILDVLAGRGRRRRAGTAPTTAVDDAHPRRAGCRSGRRRAPAGSTQWALRRRARLPGAARSCSTSSRATCSAATRAPSPPTPGRWRSPRTAILRGCDQRVALPERQFFYLPLMHSEVLADQDRAVRLMLLSFGRTASCCATPAPTARSSAASAASPSATPRSGARARPEEVAFLDGGRLPGGAGGDRGLSRPGRDD